LTTRSRRNPRTIRSSSGAAVIIFPDLFGIERADRWELLAQHARRTWALMQKNNTRVIGFNVAKFDSADARKAYEVFARQTDGLLAILVFQYSAYEAGAGKTFWVKDRNGVEVPVVSARYSIWSHANRPRAGTPAKVAREIRETVERTPQGDLPRYDWVIAHVWSWFKAAPGTDENAEEMPQAECRRPRRCARLLARPCGAPRDCHRAFARSVPKN
jgi:hypothetical protein